MNRIPKTESCTLVQNSQVGKTKKVYVPYCPTELGGGILGVFETKDLARAAIGKFGDNDPWDIWEIELNVPDYLSV